MLNRFRGTIEEGPKRFTQKDITTEGTVIFVGDITEEDTEEIFSKVFVKVSLKAEYGSSEVAGKGNLFGGTYNGKSGAILVGKWIPLTFRNTLDPSVVGWPRIGDEVTVWEDTLLKEIWAEPFIQKLPEDNYKSLDKLGPVVTIVY